MLKRVEKNVDEYQVGRDKDRVVDDPGFVNEAPEMIFRAGQSKRVWGELYKVQLSLSVIFLSCTLTSQT